MRRVFLTLFITTLFVIPALVSAQTNTVPKGLVPCDGPECQTCDVIQLGQNLINFFVGIASFVGVAIFSWAGFLMITAGGDTGKVSKARGMFTNVLFGIVIVLVGWLIVDTVMKYVFIGSPLDIEAQKNWKFGPWNQIQCVALPVNQKVLNPGPGTIPVLPGKPSGTCSPLSIGPCSESALQGVFQGHARAASQICNFESGGNATIASRVDIMRTNGRPFSFGLFQINITVNTISCDGKNLNCPKAFKGRNYDADIVNEQLYNECANAARNPTCNIAKARDLFIGSSGRWSAWQNTAQRCGLL